MFTNGKKRNRHQSFEVESGGARTMFEARWHYPLFLHGSFWQNLKIKSCCETFRKQIALNALRAICFTSRGK